MAKKSLICEENKKEIFWNILNSLISGGLVFLGSFLSAGFTLKGLGYAFLTSAVVALTKFKEYWDGEKDEYSTKILQFIGA